MAVGLENPGQSTPRDCSLVADASPGTCEAVQKIDELRRSTHGNASIWAEALSTSSPDTRVILRYGHDTGWLADQPAMIAREVGAGSIAYLGTLPETRLMSTVLNDVAREAHAVGIDDTHNAVGSNVEICERVDEAGHRVVIVINHNDGGKWITLGGHLRNLLPGIDMSYSNQAPSQPITQFHSPAGGRRVAPVPRRRSDYACAVYRDRGQRPRSWRRPSHMARG